MEVFVHQSLKQGIKFHRVPNLLQAKLTNEKLLNLKPNHPDANHNLGVLMVANTEHEQSINFFIAALDANPISIQFWIRYIQTLIQINRIELASNAFVFVEDQCDSVQVLKNRRIELMILDIIFQIKTIIK